VVGDRLGCIAAVGEKERFSFLRLEVGRDVKDVDDTFRRRSMEFDPERFGVEDDGSFGSEAVGFDPWISHNDVFGARCGGVGALFFGFLF